jgi:peptidyl-prolyl cis-trans isomerase C
MAKARARHILVSTKEKCEDLKTQIESGGDFASLAKEHSTCPSGKQGGDLGEFGPGQMVKEFDSVVFSGNSVIICWRSPTEHHKFSLFCWVITHSTDTRVEKGD